MKIFIPVVGQFTNVGDIIHRRVLLSWIQNKGELHVFVGNAPDSFIKSLQLYDSSHIYRNLIKWLWAIIKSFGQKSVFIFNPGEINLRRQRLIGELALIPFILMIKISRGKLLRIGIAAKKTQTSLKWLWKIIFRFSNKIYWRTYTSKEYFKLGTVIPDLAFYDEDIKENKKKNNHITISMRFDCPYPVKKWFEVIKNTAKRNKVDIIVVSQVRMDNDRSINVANDLNAKLILWQDEKTHFEQEEIVRAIYKNSEIIISDRLHVLIAGATEGAIPCVLLTNDSRKVSEHFSVVNINNISKLVNKEKTEEELTDFLQKQFARKEEIQTKIKQAKIRLEEVRKEVLDLLS
ncbi:MAG: polysaccharide pyruvyl transferase family protein [Bacteroidales bacterium]|nr:polysaccharide pyruvyl transferase family protein [Bacteroidales bacterium]